MPLHDLTALEAAAAVRRGEVSPVELVGHALDRISRLDGGLGDFVPDFDDYVVESLRNAGAISVGKTATPEFGLACYTETDIGPPARNPWDVSRTPGGSSGGSAAAVAAGLVALAQGSDGGGSIRIPAAACGLVGLKPARGRVSKGPLDIDSSRLSVYGGLARTVRDAAALLDAV